MRSIYEICLLELLKIMNNTNSRTYRIIRKFLADNFQSLFYKTSLATLTVTRSRRLKVQLLETATMATAIRKDQ